MTARFCLRKSRFGVGEELFGLAALEINHNRPPVQAAILTHERGVHGNFVIVRHGRTDAEWNGNSTYPGKGLTYVLACRPASVIPHQA
ncbi:MAG: hypothetical protein ABSH01_12725 [Terriglobia bacterium]